MHASGMGHLVILFYAFTPIDDPEALRGEQRALCERLGLQGRMLIAHEGINATFEGTPAAIAEYKDTIKADPRFAQMPIKESASDGTAFHKLEIKVRAEVVTLGAGEFDVPNETAAEMTAEELEALYESGEDFVVLDLRNDYEIEVGQFEKTIDPGLKNFRDLTEKLPELALLKNKKVITVCTGGIRCEKATCLMRREGFTNMYQLKDGIHTYMQRFPGRHFKGSLFVFDNRMTTPVVDTDSREVIGRCHYCAVPSEHYVNDDRERPSRKMICCESCAAAHPELRGAVTV